MDLIALVVTFIFIAPLMVTWPFLVAVAAVCVLGAVFVLVTNTGKRGVQATRSRPIFALGPRFAGRRDRADDARVLRLLSRANHARGS